MIVKKRLTYRRSGRYAEIVRRTCCQELFLEESSGMLFVVVQTSGSEVVLLASRDGR